jgi:hypothetical protein
MGWCDSPAYFCAASETARDVAETLAQQAPGSLPEHPLEGYLVPPAEWSDDDTDMHAEKFLQLLEVYVDDFILLAQTEDRSQLEHLSRAMLHAIHAVFPPPSITGHDGEDPIALKKLKQGDGLWTARKEILGWVFDGARRCIELPPDKVEKILADIRTISRQRRVPRKTFERLRGRLRHACIGLPAAKGLMSPIDAALRSDRRSVPVKNNQLLREALTDFASLIRAMGTRPTHCRELVAAEPGYIGYCDASKWGAGGVWLSGTLHLDPIVWRIEWPEDIRQQLVSFTNPKGALTNSDLEMAAMLIHYVVLEHLVDLKHVHVAAWCDNTPTVCWTNKLGSPRSRIPGRLARALAMRIHANEASPLISVSIAGVENVMADMASRTFHRNTAAATTFTSDDDSFLHTFSSAFPLQNGSWRAFRLSNKLTSRVFSELRNETSTLESWKRITKSGSAIGSIGSDSSNRSVTWTPCSPTSARPIALNSCQDSLSGSGGATTVKALECELQPYKSRSVPSERLSSWPVPPTLPTVARANTGPS